MAVGLPPEVKGTHMSRFIELLEKKRPALTPERLLCMLDEMKLPAISWLMRGLRRMIAA